MAENMREALKRIQPLDTRRYLGDKGPNTHRIDTDQGEREFATAWYEWPHPEALGVVLLDRTLKVEAICQYTASRCYVPLEYRHIGFIDIPEDCPPPCSIKTLVTCPWHCSDSRAGNETIKDENRLSHQDYLREMEQLSSPSSKVRKRSKAFKINPADVAFASDLVRTLSMIKEKYGSIIRDAGLTLSPLDSIEPLLKTSGVAVGQKLDALGELWRLKYEIERFSEWARQHSTNPTWRIRPQI